MISKLLKKNEKGFTLMEMLIVVAIIAVLVAIAIPTFNSSLNKAKAATDAANIRAGYASAMLKVLESDMDAAKADVADGTVYYLQKDGTVATTTTATTTTAYACQGKNEAPGIDVAGSSVTWEIGNYVTYTYNATSGKVTIASTATAPTT